MNLVWADNGSQKEKNVWAENGWSNAHAVSLIQKKTLGNNPSVGTRIVQNWSRILIPPYGMQFYSKFVVL